MEKIKAALEEKREINFEVSHPQRSYAGYTVYRLQLKINISPPEIIHYHFIGWKRYNDFKKLHKDLKSVFPRKINSGFPVFPKGKIFGRFEESEIEERRQVSSNFLQFILSEREMLFEQNFQKFVDKNEPIDKEREIEEDDDPSISYRSIVDEVANLPISDDPPATTADNTITEQDSTVSLESDDSVFANDLEDSLSIEDNMDNRRTWLREAARSICESDIELDPPVPSSEASVLLDEPLVNDDSPDEDPIDGSGEANGSDKKVTDDLTSHIPDFNQKFDFDDRMSQRIEETVQHDDYVYQASVAMGNAIEQEELGNFDAAFDMYKFGVGLLLRGVQNETDVHRREAVRRKTAQYLLRAELLYNSSLKSNNNNRAKSLPSIGDTKWRFRLSDVKVFGIIKNVMLVQKGPSNEVFVMKVLHKKSAEYKNSFQIKHKQKHERNLYNCHFMTKLMNCVETETGVYLLLQHIVGGRLWDYLSLPIFTYCATKQSYSCSNGNLDVNGNTCEVFDSQFKSGSYEKPRGRVSSVNHKLKRTVSISNGYDEDYIKVWAAQIALGLMGLHSLDILCRDLNPKNILIDCQGNIKLTYFCNVDGIDYTLDPDAISHLYTSPEVEHVGEMTKATDWWSYGALLFELIMGQSLYSCHPNGINNSSIITLPKRVSNEACSLLGSFLQFNPRDRLGSGPHGSEEIKSHPFFSSINWEEINM